MKSSDRVSASTRYHDLHTNDAAFRSRRVLRNWSTFSSTFSSTWSGYGAWNSMELGPGPATGPVTPLQFRVLLDDSAMSAPRRSNGGERSSSSDISVRSFLMLGESLSLFLLSDLGFDNKRLILIKLDRELLVAWRGRERERESEFGDPGTESVATVSLFLFQFLYHFYI
jgi:hypothetical protein